VALLAGCGAKQPGGKVRIERDFSSFSSDNYARQHTHSTVLDLDVVQDAKVLPSSVSAPRVDESKFMARYFWVWEHDQSGDKVRENAFWGVRAYAKGTKAYYDAQGRAYPDSFYASIRDNANEAAWASVAKPAVTLRPALLRNAPTDSPMLYSPKDRNNYLPFDNLANSMLSTNQPLFLSHYTRDGKWALVVTDSVAGWVHSSDVREISASEQAMMKSAKFIAITRDKTAIKAGGATIKARVGTLLMHTGQSGSNYTGRIITKDGVSDFSIAKSAAQPFPVKMSADNLKTSINSILGEPYGWGGYDYNRDCSLYTKDMMAQYGIWLPRNSKAQANAYAGVSLTGLSNDEKERIIIAQGVPYRTIIQSPGHIMLYTGVVNGKPTVAHSAWGLKTKNGARALFGQNVLSTLEIGDDREDIAYDRLLLSRAMKMVVLGQ